MKISCGIVQDLLPLYHDGACCKESAEIVEAHLQSCATCKKLLTDMDADIMPGTAEEIKPLASIGVSWGREKRRAFIRGLAIALCVCIVFAAGVLAMTQWKCVPMDKDDLVLLEIFQTADGWIYFEYEDLYSGNYYSTSISVGKDGNGYVECYRPILAKREDAPHRYGTSGVGFERDAIFPDKDGKLVAVDRIYLGIADQPERSILVWEEGMEIRPATQEEEEMDFY